MEDIFLLRVDIDCRPESDSSPDDADYFVYRAGNQRSPWLSRLERPHPFFHDDDIGLLSRDANYTIAVLIATGTPIYDLHIFHSENPANWIYRTVLVTEPQRMVPMVVPEKCVSSSTRTAP